MLNYAVIGHNINYSKSPEMHTENFNSKQINARYTIINIDDITKEIDNLRHLNGFNVTVPYKELIIPYLDNLSSEAKEINAVNTVINQNGILIGHNTDLYGFHNLLKRNINLNKNYKTLLIGAGGASRAAYYVLNNILNYDVTVANRTIKKAQKFTRNDQVITLETAEKNLGTFDLIINATSVGAVSYCSVININNIKHGSIFIDLNYQTNLKFLNDARKLGAKTINGKDMLVYQAAKAFKIWFNDEANVSSMYKPFND